MLPLLPRPIGITSSLHAYQTPAEELTGINYVIYYNAGCYNCRIKINLPAKSSHPVFLLKRMRLDYSKAFLGSKQ